MKLKQFYTFYTFFSFGNIHYTTTGAKYSNFHATFYEDLNTYFAGLLAFSITGYPCGYPACPVSYPAAYRILKKGRIIRPGYLVSPWFKYFTKEYDHQEKSTVPVLYSVPTTDQVFKPAYDYFRSSFLAPPRPECWGGATLRTFSPWWRRGGLWMWCCWQTVSTTGMPWKIWWRRLWIWLVPTTQKFC